MGPFSFFGGYGQKWIAGSQGRSIFNLSRDRSVVCQAAPFTVPAVRRAHLMHGFVSETWTSLPSEASRVRLWFRKKAVCVATGVM